MIFLNNIFFDVIPNFEEIKFLQMFLFSAFVSNPELVTSFFMQKFLEEFFTKPENQLPLTSPTGSPSATVDQILKLINDPCSGVHDITIKQIS